MRIISLVPSWTETFIEAATQPGSIIEVVGRTRFCIHPENQIQNIPAVGGTKSVDWNKVAELKPDLVILDKEENEKKMADECPVPWFATHVQSIEDVPSEINRLAERIGDDYLKKMATGWESLQPRSALTNLECLPDHLRGVIRWGKQPESKANRIHYVIWKDPWMEVGPDTFIGSVLRHEGLGGHLIKSSSKYPEFQIEGLNPEEDVLLLSSEPFPFAKHPIEKEWSGAYAIIDGEKYSWFGVRSFRFLAT